MLILRYDYSKPEDRNIPDVFLVAVQDDSVRSDVLVALHQGDVLSDINSFQVEGVVNQWGRPEIFRNAKVVVSGNPIQDLDPDETMLELPSGETVHVALTGNEGEQYPISKCHQGDRKTADLRGIMMPHPEGGYQLFELDGDQLKDAPPVLVPYDMPALMTHAAVQRIKNGEQAIRSLGEGGGLVGTFTISEFQRLEGLHADVRRLDDLPEARAEALKLAVEEVRAGVQAETDRSLAVRNIISARLNYVAAEKILAASDFEKSGSFQPGYREADDYHAAVLEVALSFMNDLRDKGLATACPNNGPRDVAAMNAWNSWISGELDDVDEKDYEARSKLIWLQRSPAFDAFKSIVSMSDKDLPQNPTRIDAINALIQGFERAEDALLDPIVGRSMGAELESQQTGDRHCLCGPVLTPELSTYDQRDPHGRMAPCENLDQPKLLRHVAMQMPSSQLIISDSIDVPGFNEGLEKLIGDEDYEISNADGLDARARDYFEKAGIGIVQVGNSSPYGYAERNEDGGLILRMGHVYDDDIPEGEELVEPEFTTCTDIWANTFADQDVVLDVMMASGQYSDRADALEALDHWVEDYGNTRFDIGSDTLHLYAPTGTGSKGKVFDKTFAAEEVAKADWRYDQFILSTAPLSVDPELLDPEKWEWRAEYEAPEHSDSLEM